MYGHNLWQSMNQPGKVANPACGQLNMETILFPCPRSRLKTRSHETDWAIPSRVSLLILHPKVDSGVYSRDSSRFTLRRLFIPSTVIESGLLYQVTQLPTNDVHCRESAGTGPFVIKVVRATGAAFSVSPVTAGSVTGVILVGRPDSLGFHSVT